MRRIATSAVQLAVESVSRLARYTQADGVRKLNEVLCSLLLGGVHTEVLHSEELVIGALHEKASLFAYMRLR